MCLVPIFTSVFDVRVGGNYNNNDNAGLWYWNCNNTSSNSNSNVGARLLIYINKITYTSFSLPLGKNKSLWVGLVG